MRVLLQRVSRASVTVDDSPVGAIERGLLLLVGVTEGDDEGDAQYLAGKTATMRIFEDDDGRMNRSLIDVGGRALVVSQFTLYADVRKGRRPSFVHAAKPDVAEPLVEYFAECLGEQGVSVAVGQFGAHMMVDLVNDGPVTIWLDTADLRG